MKRWFASVERFASRREVTVALAAGLPCVVILLAILQYRWISRVSDAEAQRTRAGIEGATQRLAGDFNSEIGRLVQSLLPMGPPESIPGDDLLPERYWAWLDSAEHPRLLGALYSFSRSRERMFAVRKLDGSAGVFQPSALPAHLAALEKRLEEHWSRPAFPIFVSERNALAVVFRPRTIRRSGWRAGPDSPPLLADMMILVELDRRYILEEYLPELVRRHLGREFAIQVMTRDGKVFSDLPAEFAADSPPDASASLLGLPRPGGPGPGRRGKMGGPGPGFRPGVPPGMPGGPPPIWELQVWPRSGTLDEIIAQARFRNLAISFAVLGLMLAGAAMLALAVRRAQRLARLQMNFVAGVSHELRTPLSVIGSAAENIADGVVREPERLRQYGSLIRQEGRRLSEMLEQLLSFAGAETGGLRGRLQPVEVAQVIREAARTAQADLDKYDAAVSVQTSEDLPKAQADPGLLALCLRNLIINAAKHGGAGQRIEVDARAVNGWVEIAVCDRGPGIDPAEEPYVFDAFYRGRRALEDQTPGAGIGLSLVKRIMEAHGGGVSAASRTGEGATFTLRLRPAPGENGNYGDGAPADH
jgi:signal transduction histidine kinase